jgi:hypothetical protein
MWKKTKAKLADEPSDLEQVLSSWQNLNAIVAVALV